jgi:hypothetical protein
MRAGAILASAVALLPDLAAAQQMQGCEDHKDLVRRLGSVPVTAIEFSSRL